MAESTDQYVRQHPAGVAIKKGTDDVPADGRFHLIQNGEPVAAFKRLVAATTAYKEAVARTGWQRPVGPDTTVDIAGRAAQEFLDSAEEFWSRASQFRRKGGKGR
jgi:hypothetical protein